MQQGACGDIHPVAVDVGVFNDDVAEIDANPKYDPLVFADRGVALGHPKLHGNRTGNGFNNAWELYEDAVAGGFDDAALVLGYFGIDEFAAMLFEPCQRASLIVAHEP